MSREEALSAYLIAIISCKTRLMRLSRFFPLSDLDLLARDQRRLSEILQEWVEPEDDQG